MSIKALIAIEQQGNIARAALALNISQAAMSLQLKSLEQSLGYSLFTVRHLLPP